MKLIFRNWKFGLTILAPILLTLLPVFWNPGDGATGKEPYAAYVICLMAIYWMLECIPIPVTSFIPIILFPAFGILSTDRVTCVYLQDSLLFLLGGCIIALAFEYSNLHSRIALKVIKLMGAKISQLLMGIMLTTMVLSMWMNNTSTTAMMVPIVNALTDELRVKMLQTSDRRRSRALSEDDGTSIALQRFRSGSLGSLGFTVKPSGAPSITSTHSEAESRVRCVHIMFLLGTAYASNIGGTGVITGSSTNLVALDLIRKYSEDPKISEACRPCLEISFLNWMMFNVPPMLLSTLFAYIYLQLHFIGVPKKWLFWRQITQDEEIESQRAKILEKSVHRTICQKYEELGPMSFHECGVLVFFFIVVTLWIFKDPQFVSGWDSLFPKTRKGKSIITEATPTLMVAILMFMVPSKWKYFKNISSGSLSEGLRDTILNWDTVQEKFPWGIFMLLGGGASMALGAKESGLNAWFERVLAGSEALQSLPEFILLAMILVTIAFMTTLASNTAVAAIFTPILLGMAYAKNVHPLFLVLPATTVASYAFVLPVSTPPNAIVYNASSDLKLRHIMIPGFVINIVSIFLLLFTTYTTGNWTIGFNSYNGECSKFTSNETVQLQ